MSNLKGFRGYVTARPFGGYCIPVPMQNLILRDYCQRNALDFILPVNENNIPDSYVVLNGLVRAMSGCEGVVMASIHMLPGQAAERKQLLRRIIAEGQQIRCVIEDLVIRNEADIAWLEDLHVFGAAADNNAEENFKAFYGLSSSN